jgi:protein-tyrosine phosphatase
VNPYNFGPASPDEPIVFGACSPAPGGAATSDATVAGWIEYMRGAGVQRVVCLLPGVEETLLPRYRRTWGDTGVLHAPVTDFTLPPEHDLAKSIAFLQDADAAAQPALVHCGGGIGRTGVVLAAWLVRTRGYTIDEAVEAMQQCARRDPFEAAATGRVSREEIRARIEGER